MSETIELDELRDSIRQVLADHRGDSWVIPEEEGRGLDRALWAKMAELGWLALGVPEEFGGLGLALAHLAVLYEELGRELASVPALSTLMVAGIIAAKAPGSVRDRFLPDIVAGSCLVAVALPGVHGTLARAPDGTVTGTLRNLAFGDVADVLAVPIRSGNQVAMALVPASTPGVRIAGRPLVDLTRSSGDAEFDHLKLDDIAMLPLSAADWAELEDHAAIGIASDAAGMAGSLFEMTLDYLKTREQFGRPIGSFQALKARMADWKAKLEAATALSRHAALQLSAEQGPRERAEASAAASGARAYTAQAVAAFAGDAVQLHGGIGFTWEHPCHLFLKRAKLNERLFGSAVYHKERVARLAFAENERGDVVPTGRAQLLQA